MTESPIRTFNDKDRFLIDSDREKKHDPDWESRDELLQHIYGIAAMDFMGLFSDRTKYIEVCEWKPITHSLNLFQSVHGFYVKFWDGKEHQEMEILYTIQKPLPEHKIEEAYSCHDCKFSSEIINRLSEENDALREENRRLKYEGDNN